MCFCYRLGQVDLTTVPGPQAAAALVCIVLHAAEVVERTAHGEGLDSFVGWVDRTDSRTCTRFHIRREERRAPARATGRSSREKGRIGIASCSVGAA